MTTIQTFLRKELLPRFKRYMDRRNLTPYKAAAELIELGLVHCEQCGKTAGRPSQHDESKVQETGGQHRAAEQQEQEPDWKREWGEK